MWRSGATGFGGGGGSASFAAGCAGGRCGVAGCLGAGALGGVWPRAPGRCVAVWASSGEPNNATEHARTNAEMTLKDRDEIDTGEPRFFRLQKVRSSPHNARAVIRVLR